VHLGPRQVIVANLNNQTLKPGIASAGAAVAVGVPTEEAPVGNIEMVVTHCSMVVGGDLARLDALVVQVTDLAGVVLHTPLVVVFSASREAVFFRTSIGIEPEARGVLVDKLENETAVVTGIIF